jgi:hypothetical protein
LVKSCVGDIPVSTIRQQLLREGIATQDDRGVLQLCREYSFPERIDQDFLRSAAFSLRHFAATITHNAKLVGSGRGTAQDHERDGRFERVAWSRRLNKDAASKLQFWVREQGADFIETADEYISRLETAEADASRESTSVAGVGVYFFREE